MLPRKRAGNIDGDESRDDGNVQLRRKKSRFEPSEESTTLPHITDQEPVVIYPDRFLPIRITEPFTYGHQYPLESILRPETPQAVFTSRGSFAEGVANLRRIKPMEGPVCYILDLLRVIPPPNFRSFPTFSWPTISLDNFYHSRGIDHPHRFSPLFESQVERVRFEVERQSSTIYLQYLESVLRALQENRQVLNLDNLPTMPERPHALNTNVWYYNEDVNPNPEEGAETFISATANLVPIAEGPSKIVVPYVYPRGERLMVHLKSMTLKHFDFVTQNLRVCEKFAEVEYMTTTWGRDTIDEGGCFFDDTRQVLISSHYRKMCEDVSWYKEYVDLQLHLMRSVMVGCYWIIHTNRYILGYVHDHTDYIRSMYAKYIFAGREIEENNNYENVFRDLYNHLKRASSNICQYWYLVTACSLISSEVTKTLHDFERLDSDSSNDGGDAPHGSDGGDSPHGSDDGDAPHGNGGGDAPHGNAPYGNGDIDATHSNDDSDATL